MTVNVMAYCSESVSPGDYGRCKQPPLSPGEGGMEGWRGGGGVRRPGDNIIIFVDDLLPRRAAATQAQLQIWQGGGVERGFSFCRRLLQARRV